MRAQPPATHTGCACRYHVPVEPPAALGGSHIPAHRLGFGGSHAEAAMLDLAVARPGHTLHRFAFGGVAFEVEADDAVRWQLWPEFARHMCDANQFPVVARVHCTVSVDPNLGLVFAQGGSVGSRRFTVERRGDAPETTVVVSRDLHAEVEAGGPGRYVASARVSPRRSGETMPQGPDAVLFGLSAALLEREGGLSLHAAAIELEGHAVLFVGPSGAGKSTAARLATGCRIFAFDRVNVAPDGAGGYTVWSLPGGNPAAVLASAHLRLPLAAILRVRQGQGAPRFEKLSAAKALFAVRESIWLSDFSPLAEEHRIDAAALLRARVRVAEIHTVLGHSHRVLLSQVVCAPDADGLVPNACEGSAS